MKRSAFLGAGTAAAAAASLAVFDPRGAVDAASAVALPIWYAASLNGSRTVSRDADRVVPAASLIKLLIALALADAVAAGTIARHARLPLRASDLVAGSDRFGRALPGRYPLPELLSAMISLSDNTAANVLANAVGFAQCNRVAAALGLHATRLRRHFYDWAAQRRGLENTTTPRECAAMMVALLRSDAQLDAGGIPQLTMRALRAQTDRTIVPAALPQRTVVGNKTGELPGEYGDAAIVGDPHANGYVVCIIDAYGSGRSAAITAMRGAVREIDRVLG